MLEKKIKNVLLCGEKLADHQTKKLVPIIDDFAVNFLLWHKEWAGTQALLRFTDEELVEIYRIKYYK